MKSCFEKNELEKYLSGWTDEANCSVIEEHLALCPQCEQTVTQLESETKTGLAKWVSLASTPAEADEIDAAEPAESDSENQIAAALDSVRQWNGSLPPGIDQSFPREHGDAPAESSKGVIGNFGQYEICELIGRGGMAEVYRARHKRLDRDVAIKLLRVPQSQIRESLNRIEREIRAVGRLRHPSIVSAVDAGEQDGVQYLATEFIDGLDLGKIARAVSPMPVAEACEMIRQAALGLDHAHANGIIHRDIKPSNLMLEKDGVVKILDFGLVRLDECSGVPAELTSVGQLLGTLDYMAPEQADRADSVDHRSDIYSLGATLFRLLAGRAPYAATASQSPLEKLRLLALDQPPKIQTLRPDLSDELAAIVDQTLSRDPAQRPASAAHLAEKLAPFCSGANVAALITQANAKAEEMQANDSDGLASMNSFRAGGSGSIIAQAPIKQIQASAGGSFKQIQRWLIGLGFTAAAIAAGIVLVLETQKGKVVIETDSPYVHVKLVAENGQSQGVRLVPGKNATRVYAGRYEIQIDDGTDSYTIDKNAFILNRGETVIAKIRVDEESGKTEVEWSENSHAYRKLKPSSGQLTAPYPPLLSTAPNAPKRMAVYQTDEDAEFLARVLEPVLEGKPDCRMEVDAAKNRLVVYAPDWVHREVQEAMTALAASRSSLDRSSPDSSSSTDPLLTESDSTKQPAPMLTEPVFEGHGISYWLNRGEFETDQTIIQKARYAVDVLTEEHASARKQARSYLFSKSPSSRPANSNWYWHVASNAGLDDKYADSLLEVLKSESLDEAKAALLMLSQDALFRMEQPENTKRPKLVDAIEIISSRAEFQDETILAEIADIIGSDRNNLSRSRSQLPDRRGRHLHRELNVAVHQNLMLRIMDTPWLGPSVVLKISPFTRFQNEPIVQTAFLKMVNSDSLDESQLIERLKEINKYLDWGQNSNQQYKIDKEFNYRLIDSLDQQLKYLAESKELSLYLSNRANFDIPTVLGNRGGFGLIQTYMEKVNQSLGPHRWTAKWPWPYENNGGGFGNNVLAIIATIDRLIQEIDRQPTLPGVAALVKATQPQRDSLNTMVAEKLAEYGNRAHYLSFTSDLPPSLKMMVLKEDKEDLESGESTPRRRAAQRVSQPQYDAVDLPVSEDVICAVIANEAAAGLLKAWEAKGSETIPKKAD